MTNITSRESGDAKDEDDRLVRTVGGGVWATMLVGTFVPTAKTEDGHRTQKWDNKGTLSAEKRDF